MNKSIRGVKPKQGLYEVFSQLTAFSDGNEKLDSITELAKRPSLSPSILGQYEMEGCLQDKIVLNDLFRKVYLPDDQQDPDLNALREYIERENLNARLNQQIRDGVSVETRSFYRKVREVIEGFIGHGPTFPVIPAWTRGATSTEKRGSSVGRRLHQFNMSKNLLSAIDGRLDIFPVVGVPYDGCSELFFVPKASDKSRVCVKPSTGNVPFQRGIGIQLFDRYQSATGLDMRLVQSRHHKMARQASIDLENATFDGKDASNSIFWEVIPLCFPQGWVDAFQASREESVLISTHDLNGQAVKYEHSLQMAAPNGCGWTFEMETILFHAVAVVTCNEYDVTTSDISVCGDDVILPSSVFDAFAVNMKKVGVLTNTDKSCFGDIPFRESCGGDYLRGIPTRGHYVKVLPTSIPAWYRLVNGLREKYYYNHDDSWSSGYARELWVRCVRNIPLQARMFGPRFLGNRVIQTENSSLYTTRIEASINAGRLPYALPYSQKDRTAFVERMVSESPWQHVVCLEMKIPESAKTDFPSIVRELGLSHSTQLDWILSGDLRMKGGSITGTGRQLQRDGKPLDSTSVWNRAFRSSGRKAHYKYGEIIEYLPSEDGSYDHMYTVSYAVATPMVFEDEDSPADILADCFHRAIELYLVSTPAEESGIDRLSLDEISRWIPAIKLPMRNNLDTEKDQGRLDLIKRNRAYVQELRIRVARRKVLAVLGSKELQSIDEFGL